MPQDLLERHRSLRILVSLIITLLLIFLASLVWSALMFLGDVILLFFLAWVIAFILEPVSIVLQRRGLPRTLAVAIIYLALLIVVSGAIVLAVPSIEEEVKLLASELTTALSTSNLNTLGANAATTLRHFGFSQKDAENIVSSISGQIPDWALSFANNAVDATTTLLTSIFTVLFDAFLVLILSFYMMLDGDRLVESLVVRLPPVWQPDIRIFQRNVEQIFGGFFRAQLAIGAIYGLLTWLTLLGLGQQNGLLVAMLSGAIMLVPFIGPFFAIIPPVLLILLQSPSGDLVRNLIILVILQIIAQQIVMQLIAPRVFGKIMGIPPLLLFAALLIGAKAGGVWGAFFAGPIAAVVYAMVQVYYQRLARTSSLFRPVEADGQGLAAQVEQARYPSALVDDTREEPKPQPQPVGRQSSTRSE
jgi:predicted PurR-regulated permease PerM